MTLQHVLTSFSTDPLLRAVLALIVLDFAVGVLAAIKTKTFRLSYLAAFGRDDILGKVVPWLFFYTAAKFAPSVGLATLHLDVAADGFYGVVVASMAGSLASSAAELGVPLPSLPKLWANETSHASPVPPAK